MSVCQGRGDRASSSRTSQCEGFVNPVLLQHDDLVDLLERSGVELGEVNSCARKVTAVAPTVPCDGVGARSAGFADKCLDQRPAHVVNANEDGDLLDLRDW